MSALASLHIGAVLRDAVLLEVITFTFSFGLGILIGRNLIPGGLEELKLAIIVAVFAGRMVGFFVISILSRPVSFVHMVAVLFISCVIALRVLIFGSADLSGYLSGVGLTTAAMISGWVLALFLGIARRKPSANPISTESRWG